MRFLDGQSSEVLAWIRGNLAEASSVVLACRVDDSGLAVISPQLQALFDAGVRVSMIVPSISPTLRKLSEHQPLVSVMRTDLDGSSAVALRLRDGTSRALVGQFSLTLHGLTSGYGLALDGYRDAPAAQALMLTLQKRGEQVASAGTARPLGSLMQPAMDDLEAWSRGGPSSGPHSTGLVDLDSLTGTDHRGKLWLITGPVGIGKSLLALTFARTCSLRTGERTLLLSRRESSQMIAQRVLSAEARVPLHHMRAGTLTDDDWARLARRMGELADAPLWLENFTAAAAPINSGDQSWSVVIVDDLAPEDEDHDLQRLQDFAQDHACWVIVIARYDDCRDGARARVADLILDVRREDQGERQSPRAGEADLVVRHHRHGPTSAVSVAFQGHYSRFIDFGTDYGLDQADFELDPTYPSAE